MMSMMPISTMLLELLETDTAIVEKEKIILKNKPSFLKLLADNDIF